MSDRVKKYLLKYGSPSYKIFSDLKTCKYAVVVPAIAEYENIKRFIHSFCELEKTYFPNTLLLFVINNHKNSPNEIKSDNQKTLKFLKALKVEGLNIGYIDASSEGNELPEKDAGVGLARKIGMDSVLNLLSDTAKGIIICTDADCIFEKNYLTEVINFFKREKTDAAVIKFRHNIENNDTADAVINYEIFLRYYVLGLKYSKSPYAFHTIGSSMACSTEAYMNIEGMNKRKAAEDFYFLEKLAKYYPVSHINTTTVYPSSRESWRVPFGTGQRMNRFLSNARDEYVLYHPDCFKVLSGWHNIFFKSDILNSFEYLDSAKKLNNELFNFLTVQGFEKDWNNILKNSRDDKVPARQKVLWFDGFRTLKLVHHLRDKAFGVVPMFEALDHLFEMLKVSFEAERKDLIPPRDIQLMYLEKLREIDN